MAEFRTNSIVFINSNGDKKILAKGGVLNGPVGLAFDKKDNLYVANYGADQIILISATDKTPKVLPFNVKKPYFLMIDESGILYVAEQGSNSVSEHSLNLLEDKNEEERL